MDSCDMKLIFTIKNSAGLDGMDSACSNCNPIWN